MEFRVISTFVGWFLLLQYFDPVHLCKSPDYPENGSYKPVKKEYRQGDKIVYSCKDRFTRFGKEESKCQVNDGWSESTPFCDVPTKLKDPRPSSDPKNLVTKVIDYNPNTCFASKVSTGESLRIHLEDPAPIDVVRIYLPKGKANFEIHVIESLSQIVKNKHKLSRFCAKYERDIEENQWVTLKCEDNIYNLAVDYMEIREKSDKSNALAICEIEAYVKGDDWCPKPPNYFIPNGQLAVGREIATLHCAEGYASPDNPRLICDKNQWRGPNMMCKEVKKSSTKTIVIAVGAAVAGLILFLLLLTVCLLCKKRNREVVVVYKSEDGYASSHVYAAGSEPEYSTVYYDSMVPQPPMTRPPPVQPVDENKYSEPYQPTGIKFGTLKSSTLYHNCN